MVVVLAAVTAVLVIVAGLAERRDTHCTMVAAVREQVAVDVAVDGAVVGERSVPNHRHRCLGLVSWYHPERLDPSCC